MRVVDRPRTWLLGIHYFLWGGDDWDQRRDIDEFLDHVYQLGFRAIELPLFHAHSEERLQTMAKRLRDAGLGVTVSTALPSQYSLVDREVSDEAVAWLRRIITEAALLGAQTLSGPLLAPVGDQPENGRRRDYRLAEQPLTAIARMGREESLTIALEPLNRFETDVVNTLAEAADLARATGCMVCVDTFHCNIEESDPLVAVQQIANFVGHVQLSENHRGPIGSGHIPWSQWCDVLDRIDYQGSCVIESFNGLVPEIARATRMWRHLSRDPWTFAADSRRYLQDVCNV